MQEITKETFASEVLQSELPVLVDFWGPQCGPCLKLMPAVEQLAQDYEGRVKVVKVEAPKNRRLCLELRVMALPTYLAYAGGQEVARISGTVTRQQLVDVSQQLAKAGIKPGG